MSVHLAPSLGMHEAVILSGALVGARELVSEHGQDAAALAAAAGLSPRAFDEPDLFVRAAAVVDFLELAARACDAPTFALQHARRLPLGILGQGWMIMRAADTVGGTSYRVLMDEVRADLAWRHVQRSDLSFGQVANLLGYDSQAAFSRAFRRWHGQTPRAARKPDIDSDSSQT